jgi:hypothetical protein
VAEQETGRSGPLARTAPTQLRVNAPNQDIEGRSWMSASFEQGQDRVNAWKHTPDLNAKTRPSNGARPAKASLLEALPID